MSDFTNTPDEHGVVVVESPFGPDETYAKLRAAIERSQAAIIFELDHTENAASADLELMPTRVISFGNPRLGTPLMQANPRIGLDLPQKMLVWQEPDGITRLAYNDPVFIARRHGLEDEGEAIARIRGALERFARAATTS